MTAAVKDCPHPPARAALWAELISIRRAFQSDGFGQQGLMARTHMRRALDAVGDFWGWSDVMNAADPIAARAFKECARSFVVTECDAKRSRIARLGLSSLSVLEDADIDRARVAAGRLPKLFEERAAEIAAQRVAMARGRGSPMD